MVHLNDSKVERGSRADRHEHLGAGRIGVEGLARILTHPGLAHVAYYLETPGMDEGYDAINLARAWDIAAGRPLDDLPPEALKLAGDGRPDRAARSGRCAHDDATAVARRSTPGRSTSRSCSGCWRSPRSCACPTSRRAGTWDADQGHDMLVLRAFVRDGVVPLLGPPTSIGDFHHGAALLPPARPGRAR